MFSCRHFENHLSDYESGQLTGFQRFSFRFHWLICFYCRRFASQYKLMLNVIPQIKWDEDVALSEKITQEVQLNRNHLKGD